LKLEETAKGLRISVRIYTNGRDIAINQAIEQTTGQMEGVKKLSKEIEDYMDILGPSIFKYLLLNKI